MGLLTFEEFRDDLNFALADKKQPGNTRLGRWVNKGYFEAAMLIEYDGLKECATTPTVVDQQEYQVPSDFLAVISVAMPDYDRVLLETSLSAMHRSDPDVTGIPKFYATRQESVYLWPVPDEVDKTIEMFYIEEPAALSGTSDVTVLPQVYDQAVHWLALRNALLDLGQVERATTFYQTAVNYVRSIMSQMEQGSESQKEGLTIARSEADLFGMRTRSGLD